MAFGFPPKYAQDISSDNLTSEQFLVLTIEAAKALDWNVIQTDENECIAVTKSTLWNSRKERIEVTIANGTPHIESRCADGRMFDGGKNQRNVEGLVSKVQELSTSFSHIEMVKRYEDLKINPYKSALLAGPQFKGFLAMFVPAEGYYVTPILININIAIWILMVVCGVSFILPNTEDLLKWGANFRPLTLEGQWWRLITNCFIHIGVFHLLMNMYALFYIGALLERHLGKTRFLAAYLLCGIAASMTSVSWHELIVSAGASGAIFGMYGVFLAMLTSNLFEKAERDALLKSILIFVGYNLVYGMRGGIDNAAHIGGLVSGIGIGYTFIPGLKKPDATNLKWIAIGLSSVLVVVGCGVAARQLSNDVGKYYAKMQLFAPLEEEALQASKFPGVDTQDKLSNIKNKSIANWDKLITLVTEADALKIPENLHEKDRKLLKYCGLRLQLNETRYRSIRDNSSDYSDSIGWYNSEITQAIKSLKESVK